MKMASAQYVENKLESQPQADQFGCVHLLEVMEKSDKSAQHTALNVMRSQNFQTMEPLSMKIN